MLSDQSGCFFWMIGRLGSAHGDAPAAVRVELEEGVMVEESPGAPARDVIGC